jgi:hypothetical protein
MRSSAWNEIEYLGAVEGVAAKDANWVREMWRRLDALRRFDQNFCDADWRPDPPISGALQLLTRKGAKR